MARITPVPPVTVPLRPMPPAPVPVFDSPDVFLAWLNGENGRPFYARQLRDAKVKPMVETFDAPAPLVYAKICGWALARSHAKAGDTWSISGYLGKSDAFDTAIERFALAYADQTEADHAALKRAVRAGKAQVLQEA